MENVSLSNCAQTDIPTLDYYMCTTKSSLIANHFNILVGKSRNVRSNNIFGKPRMTRNGTSLSNLKVIIRGLPSKLKSVFY